MVISALEVTAEGYKGLLKGGRNFQKRREYSV